MKEAKKLYFQKQIVNSDNALKATWKIVRQNTKENKSNQINELKIVGKTVTNPCEIVNSFNHFFINIGNSHEIKIKTHSHSHKICHQQSSLFLNPIYENDKLRILKNLRSSNCRDIHDISTYFVQQCSNQILGPLTNLVNQILITGFFPMT